MAKDKEKAINPAAAARKAEKAKALKKGKAAVTQQRNTRLAKQNPHRIQTQISDLKALEANHTINAREKKQLEELERDLARVIKAKEAVGEKYTPRTQQQEENTRRRPENTVLGKRTRADRHFSPQSSDTDPDVADIPMPRDTPPPMPSRRKRPEEGAARQEHGLPEKPVSAPVPSQAVYESKAVLRDLRKEAAAFVPAAVRKRIGDVAGAGAGTAESGGVRQDGQGDEDGEGQGEGERDTLVVDEKDERQRQQGDVVDDLQRLQDEEERWRREMKQVTVEEVEDEDA